MSRCSPLVLPCYIFSHSARREQKGSGPTTNNWKCINFSNTTTKEDDDRKVLEELTCSKVCAHCYQGSWRGDKKHFKSKL